MAKKLRTRFVSVVAVVGLAGASESCNKPSRAGPHDAAGEAAAFVGVKPEAASTSVVSASAGETTELPPGSSAPLDVGDAGEDLGAGARTKPLAKGFVVVAPAASSARIAAPVMNPPYVNCNPPFFTDPKGVKHFKIECVQ